MISRKAHRSAYFLPEEGSVSDLVRNCESSVLVVDRAFLAFVTVSFDGGRLGFVPCRPVVVSATAAKKKVSVVGASR